jgi:hypothetical protein
MEIETCPLRPEERGAEWALQNRSAQAPLFLWKPPVFYAGSFELFLISKLYRLRWMRAGLPGVSDSRQVDANIFMAAACW